MHVAYACSLCGGASGIEYRIFPYAAGKKERAQAVRRMRDPRPSWAVKLNARSMNYIESTSQPYTYRDRYRVLPRASACGLISSENVVLIRPGGHVVRLAWSHVKSRIMCVFCVKDLSRIPG